MLILISFLIWFSRARLTVWCPGLMYVLFIVLFSDPVQAQQQFGKIFQKNLNKVSSADTIQNKRSLLNNINKQSSSMSLDPTGSNLSGKIVLPVETVGDEHTDRNQYKGSIHDTTNKMDLNVWGLIPFLRSWVRATDLKVGLEALILNH